MDALIPEPPSSVADRLRIFARRERPSLAAGAAAAAFLYLIAARLPWADDLMLHLAVLHRLIADPMHPGSPVVAAGGGSSIYDSPYMLTLALLGRAFGLGPSALYGCAAIVDVTLLLTGLYRFVRTLTASRWAPPLALVGLLLWWGTSAIAWSGFLSLLSLADTEAYPSTLATALTLHLWSWLNDRGARTLTCWPRMAGAGALFGLILLTHQFTALNATIGCIAILISRHAQVRTRTAARALAAGVAAAAAVVAAWPYYHLWDVSQGELDVLDPVHKPLYQNLVAWYAVGLTVGIVALGRRWRRTRTDVLVLLFLGAGTMVAYGALAGHWSYGRCWPMAMLATQVAIAVELAEARAGLPRRLCCAAAAVMTVVGLVTQAGAALYLLPSAWQARVIRSLRHTPVSIRARVDDRARLAWLDRYLRPDDVVAADARSAQLEIAAHGAYGVTTPWYLPEVPVAEWTARTSADEAILAPGTPSAQRMTLLHEYRVDWLLLTSAEELPSGLPAHLAAQGGGFRLYRVTD